MSPSKVIGAVVASVTTLFLLSVIFGSFYTVDQGEVAVVLRNGQVHTVTDAGLHYKLPLIDDAVYMSTRTERRTYDNVLAYSRDIQSASMSVTVNYRMNPADAASVYTKYQSLDGAMDRIVTPRVQNHLKVVFGQFNAATAISQRGRLVAEVTETLQSDLPATGLVVEDVLIENIDFSEAFENSVEQRMLAEVDVQKKLQNLEREKVEADIVRTQALGAADARQAKAEAEAYAIRVQGEAEAAAIAARGNG